MHELLIRLTDWLKTGADLGQVIVGFTLIIVLHELGHFVAAKWAGIRVLAFAVGFGPALVSWRQGLGLRRGSTEAEYQGLRAARAAAGVSPTEYRLNALPFGGYVKMLGQEDANPAAVSDEPDSFQRCPPWKRMIVISAGVMMNLVTAAALFVVVFMIGLSTEPARVGEVGRGSAAATAVARNAAALGVTEPGLRAEDEIVSIDGTRPDSFTDIVLASAMARSGTAIEVKVKREGIAQPLVFEIVPRVDRATKMLQMGIGPAASATLLPAKSRKQADLSAAWKSLAEAGLAGVEPGATLVRVGDGQEAEPARSAYDLIDAARRSGGKPFGAVFTQKAGQGKEASTREVAVTIHPVREYQRVIFAAATDHWVAADHLLGLMPAMRVRDRTDDLDAHVDLQPDDIFARIGPLEWPNLPEGIAEIRRHKRGKVTIDVVRLDKATGIMRGVHLGEVKVDRKGTVGFFPSDTARTSTLVAGWPALPVVDKDGKAAESDVQQLAASLRLVPGSRILRVGAEEVHNFEDVRGALERATAGALASNASSARVELTVALPLAAVGAASTPPIEKMTWTIPGADVRELHALGWASPVSADLFEPAKTLLKASGPTPPLQAIGMGLRETHRVMLSTYLTFARLFQGSIKVEHIKGPVGIADIGTRFASKGFVWLMFFMAVISVNLAVINFLPIPIADGGLFVFLVYEQLTGRPVSASVQNVATIAGLLLLASVFLIVTFNDLRNLLGG